MVTKARQVFESRKLPDLIFACSDGKTYTDCIYTQPPAFLDSSSYSFGSFSFSLETSACLHELFSLQHFQFTIMLSTASRQKSCSICLIRSICQSSSHFYTFFFYTLIFRIVSEFASLLISQQVRRKEKVFVPAAWQVRERVIPLQVFSLSSPISLR